MPCSWYSWWHDDWTLLSQWRCSYCPFEQFPSSEARWLQVAFESFLIWNTFCLAKDIWIIIRRFHSTSIGIATRSRFTLIGLVLMTWNGGQREHTISMTKSLSMKSFRYVHFKPDNLLPKLYLFCSAIMITLTRSQISSANFQKILKKCRIGSTETSWREQSPKSSMERELPSKLQLIKCCKISGQLERIYCSSLLTKWQLQRLLWKRQMHILSCLLASQMSNLGSFYLMPEIILFIVTTNFDIPFASNGLTLLSWMESRKSSKMLSLSLLLWC